MKNKWPKTTEYDNWLTEYDNWFIELNLPWLKNTEIMVAVVLLSVYIKPYYE